MTVGEGVLVLKPVIWALLFVIAPLAYTALIGRPATSKDVAASQTEIADSNEESETSA